MEGILAVVLVLCAEDEGAWAPRDDCGPLLWWPYMGAKEDALP
jgi:hypothetical protein